MNTATTAPEMSVIRPQADGGGEVAKCFVAPPEYRECVSSMMVGFGVIGLGRELRCVLPDQGLRSHDEVLAITGEQAEVNIQSRQGAASGPAGSASG